jgi:transmembrane sensor
MIRKDIPWKKIKRFFEENATDEENLELLHWLEDNPENRIILRQLHSYWKKNGTVPSDFSPEVSKALIQVHNKIGRKKVRYLGYYLSRIAAVIVFAIISLGIYKAWSVKQQKTFVSQTCNKVNKNGYVLTDGTKIWLNRNSQIRYPKQFNKDNRTIMLKGEAYFEVARDKNKPFIVILENTKITVLGTKFNINANGPKTTVSVSEGKVAFTSSKNNSVQLILTQNKEGIFDKSNGEMFQKNIDVNYLSWKTNKYIFNREPVFKILDVLAEDYNFTYEIKSNDLRENLITATFDDVPFNDIIESIGMSIDARVHYKDNHLIIE